MSLTIIICMQHQINRHMWYRNKSLPNNTQIYKYNGCCFFPTEQITDVKKEKYCVVYVNKNVMLRKMWCY